MYTQWWVDLEVSLSSVEFLKPPHSIFPRSLSLFLEKSAHCTHILRGVLEFRHPLPEISLYFRPSM